MATFTDTIRILIQADGAKASSELERVGKTAQREMDRADKSTRNWSATFTRAGVGLTTFAAVAGAGLYSAAQAADEAQQAQLRLDNTIANSPRLTEQSARAFRDLASALMAKTVVDDDAIVSSQALLGQFDLTEQQILSLTPLVVDLSRKMGVDLDAAAKAVGKAVNGSSGALKRYGIDIQASRDGTIAFDDVVQGLSASVGGFAEGEARTFTGQIEQMRNRLGEVAEGIGAGVIPVFQELLGPIEAVADRFASLDPATQTLIGRFAAIGTAVAGSVGAVSLFAGQLAKLRQAALLDPSAGLSGGLSGVGKAMGVAAGAAGVLGLAYVAMSERSDAAKRRVDELTDAVRSSGKTLEDVAAQKVAEYVGAHEDMRDVLGAAGLSTADFAAAVLQGGRAYDRVSGQISDYIGAQDAATGAGQVNIRNARILQQELDRQRAAFAGSEDQIKATNAAQSTLAGSYQGTTVAARELGTAVDGSNSALGRQQGRLQIVLDETRDYKLRQGEAADAVDEHRQALEDLIGEIDRYQERLRGNRDSSRSAALAQLDAADAVQQVADAQKTYNDTVAQYGPNSAEAAAAQRELQRAVIGAYQAQDDATQALLDNAAAQAGYDRGADNNAKSTQRYVAELVKARNETNGPTRDAINQHIAKILGIPVEKATKMTLPEIRRRLRELEEHKDGIDRVPKEKKTKVTAEGTSAASAAVQRVRDQIAGLEDRNVTVTVTTVVNFANELGRRLAESLGFAKGGPIPAGLTAMVGEEGPELLVDRDDGRTRVVGADGPEMIRTTEPGFVIPNDKIRLGDGRAFAAGMLDNGQITATFVHNGPVDASTVATLYGDDQALLDRGRRSQGLLGRLAGRRAAGGPVEGGQAYLVGETGPELVVPQSDSTVMSNQRLRQLGYRMPQVPARGGDVIVVNFHGPVASQRQAEDWVVSALASARRRGNRLAS